MSDLALIVGVTLVAAAVLPTLGLTKRGFVAFGAVSAAIPGYLWIQALDTSDDKSRALAMGFATYATIAWGFGVLVAVLQFIGVARHWAWARFPIPSLTAGLTVGLLCLLLVGFFFRWF